MLAYNEGILQYHTRFNSPMIVFKTGQEVRANMPDWHACLT